MVSNFMGSFFDPLLSKLRNLKDNVGYNMKTYEIITMNNGSLRRLSERVNHVALVDDANLLSDNKEELLLLLVLYTICQSFVKLCNIKANPKKFELLVVGKDRKESEGQEYLIL